MNQPRKRGVGRPRGSRKIPDLPAREDILLACAELFAQHGFKGTSTRMIADRVGIRQPSIFHHFARKSDILDALVEMGGVAIMRYVDDIDFSADPRQQLYDLVFFDCHFLLTEPIRINQIIALPEVRNGPLGVAVEHNRSRIIDAYRKLIAAGDDQGHFLVQDLEVVTHSIFGLGESTWTWYDPKAGLDEVTVAKEIADLALRSLLVDPSCLRSLRESAVPVLDNA